MKRLLLLLVLVCFNACENNPVKYRAMPEGLLYFTKRDSETEINQIFKMNLEGGFHEKITNSDYYISSIDVSPDGSMLSGTYKISFNSFEYKVLEIFNPFSGRSIYKTKNNFYNLQGWSPDGRYIMTRLHTGAAVLDLQSKERIFIFPCTDYYNASNKIMFLREDSTGLNLKCYNYTLGQQDTVCFATLPFRGPYPDFNLKHDLVLSKTIYEFFIYDYKNNKYIRKISERAHYVPRWSNNNEFFSALVTEEGKEIINIQIYDRMGNFIRKFPIDYNISDAKIFINNY